MSLLYTSVQLNRNEKDFHLDNSIYSVRLTIDSTVESIIN